MSIKIHGEYWITDSGVEFADGDVGDYNHAGIVILRALGELLSATLGDTEVESYEIDNFYEDLCAELEIDSSEDLSVTDILKAHFPDEPKLADLYCVANDNLDVCDFAAREWGWIRIARNNAQMQEANESSLKQLANGVLDIIEEEGHYWKMSHEERMDNCEIYVDAVNGRSGMCIPLRSLKEGKIEYQTTALDEAASKVATEQVRKMDVAAQHPHYGDKLGD